MHDDVEKKRHTLKRTEVLRKKKVIKELFDNGSSFFLYPYKIYYLSTSEIGNNQVLFSVSKKYFRNATQRNLIKRRLREAFRVNKSHVTLGGQNDVYYCFAIVYISKFILSYKDIEDKLIEALRRLNSIENK